MVCNVASMFCSRLVLFAILKIYACGSLANQATVFSQLEVLRSRCMATSVANFPTSGFSQELAVSFLGIYPWDFSDQRVIK